MELDKDKILNDINEIYDSLSVGNYVSASFELGKLYSYVYFNSEYEFAEESKSEEE